MLLICSLNCHFLILLNEVSISDKYIKSVIPRRVGKRNFQQEWDVFARLIPWQKKKKKKKRMSFELCKKLLSSYTVAPEAQLLCPGLQPRQLHLLFNLEDNKTVII